MVLFNSIRTFEYIQLVFLFVDLELVYEVWAKKAKHESNPGFTSNFNMDILNNNKHLPRSLDHLNKNNEDLHPKIVNKSGQNTNFTYPKHDKGLEQIRSLDIPFRCVHQRPVTNSTILCRQERCDLQRLYYVQCVRKNRQRKGSVGFKKQQTLYGNENGSKLDIKSSRISRTQTRRFQRSVRYPAGKRTRTHMDDFENIDINQKIGYDGLTNKHTPNATVTAQSTNVMVIESLEQAYKVLYMVLWTSTVNYTDGSNFPNLTIDAEAECINTLNLYYDSTNLGVKGN